MKRLLTALFLCLILTQSCSTVATVQTIHVGAELVYSAAQSYLNANKDSFSQEDYEKFSSYLNAFRLAIDTGSSVGPFINQWLNFYHQE